MKILLSGATGLIGEALQKRLKSHGHLIVPLTRSAPPPGGLQWDSEKGTFQREALDRIDAVVHLAGEPIAALRWTKAKKQAIYQSRVQGTHFLSTVLAELPIPPKTLICASAVGYYGDRGDELLNESSPSGTGFFPEVCRAWEQATMPVQERGVRVAQMRFGVVLSSRGGALKAMLPAFRAGLGCSMGTGKQWVSWISLDDVVSAITYVLTREQLSGPFNTVSPHPATQVEFADTLASVLHRPRFLRFPDQSLRIVLGEMAEAVLLASARVHPERLLRSGFEFQRPQLKGALESAIV